MTDSERFALALATARRHGCTCEPRMIPAERSNVLVLHRRSCAVPESWALVEILAAWRMPKAAA
jgi:hypothetical protein